MNAKQAIEVLSNKHLSIVNTTDGQYFATGWSDGLRGKVEDVVDLINWQDKIIDKACEMLADHAGTCPVGLDLVNLVNWIDCEAKCTTADNQEASCWRKWLEKGATP